jgi:uncharacterized damage-inducible protein DinB
VPRRPSAAEVRETLRQLRATTPHLKRAATGLTDAQLQRHPENGSWSANEVLAHLRGCADVRGAWIARMLEDNAPMIRYASPRTGMRKGNYAAEEFGANLREFGRQRTALVKTLSALPLTGWSRAATLTGTSPGWKQTVFEVAYGLATHELAHFDQITSAARQSK